MDQNRMVVIAVIVIAVIVAAIIAFITSHQRRSQKLRERFGPEYDRVMRQEGDTRKAEGVLQFREKRRETFNIRPLTAADRSSFAVRWNEVQARFVDDPRGAVTVADSLVTDVMQARGYPIGQFDERAADLSSTTIGPHTISPFATARADLILKTCARRWSTIARCFRNCSPNRNPKPKWRGELRDGNAAEKRALGV